MISFEEGFAFGQSEEPIYLEENYFSNDTLPQDTFTGIEFGLFPNENETPPEQINIATVANIFAKVAISKQPLEPLDIITIGLVGVANAGVIAKGIRSGIGNSGLRDFSEQLGKRIGLITEDTEAITKIQEGIGKVTDKIKNAVSPISRGADGISRESILARLKPKKVWTMFDDITKLSDDELAIVNKFSDRIEMAASEFPEKSMKFVFEENLEKGFMWVEADGKTIAINKAKAGTDLIYAKSIFGHETGHFAHINPKTGKFYTEAELLQGIDNSLIKTPEFIKVDKFDRDVLEQIIADKYRFTKSPELKSEFSEWIKNVHLSNLINTEFDLAKPELIRSLVYAKSFDPELLPIIESAIKNRWGNVIWLTNFDEGLNGVQNFIKFSEGVVIK